MRDERDVPPEVARLQWLIRIPTVSHRDPELVDTAAFDAFLAELAECFPLVHERLDVTRIDTHGLLLRWPGASADRPVVLMAHLDVVPVDDGAPWRHPPFGAEIHDGAIWGRGTLDDKGALAAICEAVEALLAEGHTPAQDVWLSFGCNEEVSGTAAGLAVEELTRRGVRPWLVLDEGGAVAAEAFPGVAAPIGVVGVGEKGVTSIELFRRMAPHAPLALRPLLANATRLRPLLVRALIAAGAEPAALTRTTFAVTTLSGSPALNVIASTATAGVNIRIMIGDTVAGTLEHVRRAIRDDSIEVRVVERNEPSPVSPVDDPAFALIERTVAATFSDAVPAPYVMMAATDGRFFTAICDRVYRFAPFRMSKAQREAIHAYDEHLGIDAYLDGIGWYRRLIEGLPATAESTG